MEQDQRAVKCVTRPMHGFKSFHSVRSVLAGTELMYMIRKGQPRWMAAMACRLPTSFIRGQD
ncbi:DDE-type integrase/transposase/recombinase [Noviherbaspirillum sp. 1P10PC]|uniref:hypothetical protein n=1 Tax=Noviherbaspirillum sp. 1P10PC TaxID=3132292 RepID=UPI0039A3A4A8